MTSKKGFIFVCFLLLFEGCARITEDPYNINFLFDWKFWDTRVGMSWLVYRLPESPRIPLTAEGFRGTWEKNTKKEDEVRIMFVGSGHGFADNLDFGLAWSERLESSLKQKQKKEIEVWNFSVNGSTVVFTERCLLHDIVLWEPDVVVFSHSGYNESIRSDIAESSIVHDGVHVMNFLLSSAFIRQGVLLGAEWWNRWTGTERTAKVPVDEFVERYERIIATLQKNGIPMILLQQEVITPDISPFWYTAELQVYRKAFQSLAQRHGLVYLDPRTLIRGHDAPYFENKEYYSAQMHESIAQEIEPYISLLVFP